jgi:hypothetical protein
MTHNEINTGVTLGVLNKGNATETPNAWPRRSKLHQRGACAMFFIRERIRIIVTKKQKTSKYPRFGLSNYGSSRVGVVIVTRCRLPGDSEGKPKGQVADGGGLSTE